jgi:glutathione S-transferase
MSLTLYFHPFASFCQKALVALYENDTPFAGRVIDLSDEAQRAELARLWPFAKFPVLRDEARGETVPEATIIIEYLAQHYPGRSVLVPADPDRARETRLRDRFYDLYVNEAMQKIVTDRLRPAGKHDPQGVAQARGTLETAYGMIEKDMETRTWATGDAFGMADCAAAPSLWYANLVQPLGDRFPRTSAYLARLVERPSFARVLAEARPYLPLFPRDPDA